MNRILRLFFYCAGALLLGAALVRFLILMGNVPQLHRPDPLLGIPIRSGLLVAGVTELAVALVCLFSSRLALQAALLACVSLSHLLFRIGLVRKGVHAEWTCLGSLTDPLHLAGRTSGFALSFLIPCCLLLGAVAALVWVWVAEPVLARRRKEQLESLKMACPACGLHIKFAVQNLGQNIPCPQCKTNVTLRKPGTLKIECYFCKGHVEFPAHALGRRIDCPHCRHGITLQLPKQGPVDAPEEAHA